MSGDIVLYVYGLRENARYTLIRSPQWASTQALLDRANAHPMRSRRLRGWCVRSERIGDVIAAAEGEGVRVVMRGALEDAS